jgi:hypothetical protein
VKEDLTVSIERSLYPFSSIKDVLFVLYVVIVVVVIPQIEASAFFESY